MIVRRSLLAVFVIFAAATINFWLPRTTGRDPIAERLAQIMAEGGGAQMDMTPLIETYQRKFGLDQPLWQQYATYLWDTATLDWGYSISSYPTRVSTLVAEALPWTIGLMLVSTIVAFVVGSLVGAFAAWRGNLKLIQVFMPALMLTAGIPYYLIGLVLIYFLSFRLGWFPIAGGAPIGTIPSMSWDYKGLRDLPCDTPRRLDRDCRHRFLGARHARHDDDRHRAGFHTLRRGQGSESVANFFNTGSQCPASTGNDPGARLRPTCDGRCPG